jgi:hypothetical protein
MLCEAETNENTVFPKMPSFLKYFSGSQSNNGIGINHACIWYIAIRSEMKNNIEIKKRTVTWFFV